MSSEPETHAEHPQTGCRPAQGRGTRKFNLAYLRILLLQLALTCVVALVLLPLKDLTTAVSALAGGLIYLIPTGWFTLKVLVKNNAQTPREIVANVYMSEAGKMVLTIALFSIAFVTLEALNPFSLFGTFILLQMTGWWLQFRLNRFLKL